METLDKIVNDAREELRENMFSHSPDIDECISEVADSSVPVYTTDIRDIGSSNLDMATLEPELGPAFDGSPTPSNIIAANIYEHVQQALYEYKDELEAEIEANTCDDCGETFEVAGEILDSGCCAKCDTLNE